MKAPFPSKSCNHVKLALICQGYTYNPVQPISNSGLSKQTWSNIWTSKIICKYGLVYGNTCTMKDIICTMRDPVTAPTVPAWFSCQSRNENLQQRSGRQASFLAAGEHNSCCIHNEFGECEGNTNNQSDHSCLRSMNVLSQKNVLLTTQTLPVKKNVMTDIKSRVLKNNSD